MKNKFQNYLALFLIAIPFLLLTSCENNDVAPKNTLIIGDQHYKLKTMLWDSEWYSDKECYMTGLALTTIPYEDILNDEDYPKNSAYVSMWLLTNSETLSPGIYSCNDSEELWTMVGWVDTEYDGFSLTYGTLEVSRDQDGKTYTIKFEGRLDNGMNISFHYKGKRDGTQVYFS